MLEKSQFIEALAPFCAIADEVTEEAMEANFQQRWRGTMQVIFLDVDGVLNQAQRTLSGGLMYGRSDLDPSCGAALAMLLLDRLPDASIVSEQAFHTSTCSTRSSYKRRCVCVCVCARVCVCACAWVGGWVGVGVCVTQPAGYG